MTNETSRQTADGGSETAREDEPDIADASAPEVVGSGTDASRGQPQDMARHGGDATVDNRKTSSEPVTSSQGSRTGSLLGSQSEKTGMGDGPPASGSSQGLAGGQDNGGAEGR